MPLLPRISLHEETPENDRPSGWPRMPGQVDDSFSAAERIEMKALGMLDDDGNILQSAPAPVQVPREPMATSLDALNEAYCYDLPSSFTRRGSP